MNFLLGSFAIVGIIFMITFIFIGIWLFIVALKAFRQLRYKNYILEKMYQKLDYLSSNMHNSAIEDDLSSSDNENLVTEDFFEFFDLENDNTDAEEYDNVKAFEQNK